MLLATDLCHATCYWGVYTVTHYALQKCLATCHHVIWTIPEFNLTTRPEGYKKNFMLNSAEHGISDALKYKNIQEIQCF